MKVTIREQSETDRATLDEFYADFKQTLARAEAGMRHNQPVPLDVTCPSCDLPMVARTAGTGTFLSCTGYDKPPKERCTQTINLVPGEESIAVENEDEEKYYE